jgi:hypothetical protein
MFLVCLDFEKLTWMLEQGNKINKNARFTVNVGNFFTREEKCRELMSFLIHQNDNN